MKNNIKQLRLEMGYTQEQVASTLHVTRQTIIAIEKEKYNPTLELGMRIARLFNQPVEEIFIFKENSD